MKELQRSRAVVSAETILGVVPEPRGTVLQRSRAVVSAETAQGLPVGAVPFLTSTEPRCCQRGDEVLRVRGRAAEDHFNGAALLSARRPGEQRRARRVARDFNGAALLSARRPKLHLIDRRWWHTLQRSRAVVSAETGISAARRQRENRTSTEPRCCQRGDVGGPDRVSRSEVTSTEPRCCQRGDATPEHRGDIADRTSTEPRCCQPGDTTRRPQSRTERRYFNGAALLSARRHRSRRAPSRSP